jgi:ElaA protein
MYTKHGFKTDGAEYVEGGTPHVPMIRVGGKPWRGN